MYADVLNGTSRQSIMFAIGMMSPGLRSNGDCGKVLRDERRVDCYFGLVPRAKFGDVTVARGVKKPALAVLWIGGEDGRHVGEGEKIELAVVANGAVENVAVMGLDQCGEIILPLDER